MAGTNRPPPAAGSSLHRARKVQPPRPPNAWILYRSNKFALIRQTQGRMSQATVSKIISDMWKNETEQVKRHWEREADDKKAEHQRLYPDYHYSPQKREEKVRAKEESKKARRAKKSKACDATPTDVVVKVDANATATVPESPPPPYMPQAYLVPGHQPNTAPPQPYAIQYLPEAYYGPSGPSPPISAAPSPAPYESSESPEVQPYHMASSSSSPSARPSPCSESQASSSSSQLPPNSVYFSSLPSSHQPSPNAYATQPLPTLLFQSSPPSELPLASPQVQHPSAENAVVSPTPVFPTQLSGFDFQNSEEVVNFNIPINQTQNLSQFPQSLRSSSSLESAQEMIAGIHENGVFNLGNVDTTDLLVEPHGDLEVAMGPRASTVDYNKQLFADFDYAAFQQQMASFTESGLSSTPGASSIQEDLQAFFQTPNIPDVQEYTTARQRQPSIFTQDMMDFLNFEAAEGFTEDISTVSPAPVPTQYAAAMPIFNQMTNTPTVPPATSYVPPAGAAYSSMRRVAASWKPSFAMLPSQMEEPVHSWTFSTN